ncbi:unnamed protein product [Phytophthora fragariaefolia]|uniref:Unnamed protein product n=1 Tax=Phytophthora fragariaefolia TaxID=1490495 RepID=A0A9W6YGF1_9STRA|nr:unnamed protein product [Phytophthora fragariaefolia]
MVGIWDEDAGDAFSRLFFQRLVNLGRVEAGFKKQTWTRIMNQLNQVVQQAFTKAQLQSRLQQLKKKYAVYTELIGNSGFGKCPRTGRPTAPDSVWDDVAEDNSDIDSAPGPPGTPCRPCAPITPGTSGTPGRPDSLSAPETPPSTTGRPGGACSEFPGYRGDPASSNTSDPPSTTTLGRRRRTSGERISYALEKLVEQQVRRVRQRARSQVQIAITSFIADHSTGMRVAERVSYVSYFVANPLAADAFNVHDHDTKVAYLLSLSL